VSEKENGKDGNNSVAYHILPTSSNLLGLCFVILSFMRITKMGLETIIDELVSTAIFVFLISSVMSYAAIRSVNKADYYEKIADIIFLVGLVLLTVTAIIIVFEII
jgi:magnesium-transporting ATPase (P-type)